MNRPDRPSSVLVLLSLLLSGCAPGAPPEEEVPAAASGIADVPGCPSSAQIDAYLSAWRSTTPAQGLVTNGDFAAAGCARDRLVEVLTAELGPRAGYKAGLTSQAAQQTFGVTEPVRGVLLEGMFLPDGSEVDARFGARARFEADMLAVVASEEINSATTPAEVLAHLSALIPFIELPDLALAEDQPLDGPGLTAINVGARQGVLGASFPVEASEEFLSALAGMTVRLVDQDGNELVGVRGEAILGHPLNSVLWLLGNGVRFQVGDRISLGSFGPLLVPEAGRTIRLEYQGLPGATGASVSFRQGPDSL